MTPETLRRVRKKLETVSSTSLAQFYVAVSFEVNKRRKDPNYDSKANRLPETKDCDPIRGV